MWKGEQGGAGAWRWVHLWCLCLELVATSFVRSAIEKPYLPWYVCRVNGCTFGRVDRACRADQEDMQNWIDDFRQIWSLLRRSGGGNVSKNRLQGHAVRGDFCCLREPGLGLWNRLFLSAFYVFCGLLGKNPNIDSETWWQECRHIRLLIILEWGISLVLWRTLAWGKSQRLTDYLHFVSELFERRACARCHAVLQKRGDRMLEYRVNRVLGQSLEEVLGLTASSVGILWIASCLQL